MVSLSAAADSVKEGVTDAGRRVAAVLPLWVIIVIVVVGTGLLALLVGLCCLCVCRRRRGRKAVGDNAGGAVHDFSDHNHNHHRHHPARSSTSDGCSRSSEDGPAGRAKLRKRPPSPSSSYSAGIEGADAVVIDDRAVKVEEIEEDRARGDPEFRNMAPARKTSLLSLPPILSGAWRASIGSLGGGRGPGRGGGGGGDGLNISTHGAAGHVNNWHRRRTSNAWIDDDALHGPEVSPTKRSRKSRMKSWGASIRESWQLKTPSPTLPHLPQFVGGGHHDDDGRHVGAAEHESVAMFRYGSHDGGGGDRFVPNFPPPPPPAAARQRELRLSPPRQLPKPPRQALLSANAGNAGLRPVGDWHGTGPVASASPRNRGLSYYKYEGTDQPVKSSGSPRKTERGVGVGTGVMGPKSRAPMADSTMSQILKDTEKRLQDGMMTGVAARNRSSSSPPKRTAGLGPDGMAVALVRSQSRTPSPTKGSRAQQGAASSHVRQGSQASVLSEPDSLLGDRASPTLGYHGLTSPSRSKPSQQLSPHKRRPSLVPSFASSASSLSTIHSETEEGALTPNTTAPNSSIPFGMNQIGGLGDPFMPSNKSSPASRKAPGAAGRGAPDSVVRPPRRENNPQAKSDSPLSPMTGNMRSHDTTPTRGGASNMAAQGGNKAPTPQSQRNRSSVIHFPAPTRGGDDLSDSVHRRTQSNDNRAAAPTIPNLSLTIPSDKGAVPSPLVKRLSDLAPPFRSRDQTPDVVAHPSPALANYARLSSVYDFYAGMSEPLSSSENNSWRRVGGEVRVASEASLASSSTSQYSDATAAEREQQMAALSRISMLLNREIKVSRPRPPPPVSTVRVVPQDYYNTTDARVSSTVAELRRMNSQASTYSSGRASMYSDDGSSAAMAAVRPESVVPPRRGAAARNYHALASPVRNKGAGAGDMGSVTPTRNGRMMVERADSVGRRGGSASGSEDGASLYDQDGFYATPGKRTRLRP
ncbi:hypothetical protein diail_1567 [Diaporthe ilicicola]|nr:hypothetical protein diail_1567 [Diaporthe ilicicola]